jgi:hypothetical protein
VARLAHPGPAKVEALAELLIVPAGASADPARAVGADGTVDHGHGLRWATEVTWTSSAGPGTLRLSQFLWPSGAQQYLATRLARERAQPTAEEWSVPDTGAAVFATETRSAGRVVRGVVRAGPVVAEATIERAGSDAHRDMIGFLERVVEGLPGPRWPSDTAPLEPVDITPLLLPVPAGATGHRGPETMWLLRFGADYYDDDAAGQAHLTRLGFKRAAAIAWNESRGDTFVLVTLLRFGDGSGAREWATGTVEAGLRSRPTPDVGQIPNVDGGHYAVYTGLADAQGHYGEAVLFRDTVAAMVQIYGAGASGDHLIALAQEQYARLP